MWGRKREAVDDAEPVSLDDQIARLRVLVAANARPETVGPLVSLLTARGVLLGQQGRDVEQREDRRAAAGLLRGFDGQPPPVARETELLVWMSLVLAEREAGDLDAALAAAERAVTCVGAAKPADLTLCEAFVVDLDRLRADLAGAKRRPEAVRAAELASDLATRLAEVDESAYAGLLGTAWANEASARAHAGDLDSAGALNEEAIRLLEELAPHVRSLTTALANRAQLQRRSGQWADAVATEERALAGVRSSRPATREEVGRLNSLFLTLKQAGRTEEAERTLDDAVAQARALAEADPTQASLLATVLGNQANVRGELGRFQDALVSSEEALALRERIADADPSPDADRALSMVLNNHAAVLRRVDRLPDAAVSAARSVELRRRLAEDGLPSSIALLANALNTHAEQLGHLGDGDQAVRLAEEARDLYAALPPPGAVTRLLRANQDTLGRVLAVAGRHDEALGAAQRAVDLGTAAAEEEPGELPELVVCLESLADRLSALGRGGEAEAVRARALGLSAVGAS